MYYFMKRKTPILKPAKYYLKVMKSGYRQNNYKFNLLNSEKNKIKIAVVGIGLMGSQHLKALSVSKAKLHSIVDVNKKIL